MSDVILHLDEALERVTRRRERLLADPAVSTRAARIARLYEAEAQAWSQLYEVSSERIVWRAALVAELVARRHAAAWRRRASVDIEPELVVAGCPDLRVAVGG